MKYEDNQLMFHSNSILSKGPQIMGYLKRQFQDEGGDWQMDDMFGVLNFERKIMGLLSGPDFQSKMVVPFSQL